MIQLPESLLDSLKGLQGFDEEAFKKVHASGEQVTSIRVNPSKRSMVNGQWSIVNPTHHPIAIGSPLTIHIPWAQNGYYLESRPSFTFDPLFHAGCYYVQEASSMFLEQALKQTVDLSKPLKVLDLCAAPGGKSTHIQSLISKDSLLVSNEIIRSRVNILKDNIIKWGCENVVVTNNDPKDFTELQNYFDVIVVDAPCSGSGLFRKEPDAINEWSENNVNLCSQRQQRIIADAWPSLKNNGVLIYSTCSYSKQEDEDIMDWITRQLPTANCQLQIKSDWGVIETISAGGNYGYRFWPYKVKGEGFFIACFRKAGEEDETVSFKTRNKPEQLTKKETEIVQQWVKRNDHKFIRHLDTVYAWPEQLADDFSFLLSRVRLVYSGTIIGELMRDKLIPHHALGMSNLVAESTEKIELDYEQAIQYLQRKDLQTATTKKGWQLVTYQGHSLGWVNVLPNRINNYYPKELRILKDN